MFTKHHIQEALDAYLSLNPQQKDQFIGLFRLLSSYRDLASRKEFQGHVTCSIVVLDSLAKNVLLAKHKFLRRWLFPGGHLEEHDESIVAGGLRELQEETALCSSVLKRPRVWPIGIPFMIERHKIPANPDKGEPAHVHWDFRYIFQLKEDVMLKRSDELTDLRFMPLSAAPEYSKHKIFNLLKPSCSNKAAKQLEDAIVPYILSSRDCRPLGLDGRIRVQYFVDFFAMSHDEDKREFLVKLLSDSIRSKCRIADYNGIACPKDGNVLLAYALAKKLGKPLLYIRSSVLFGKWIEGGLPSGKKLLLVDDVAADGELMLESINNARRSGYVIDRVFTLVRRTEGDADSLLSHIKVDIESIKVYGDIELRDCCKQPCLSQ